MEKTDKNVNHPAHYNVVKYVARAGHKDISKTLEDLEKAEFYLKDEIKRLKKSNIVRG